MISRKEIDRHWDGLDPDYTPEKSIEAVKALLSEEDFEASFPYRLGSAEWFNVAKGKEYYKADQTDYFSYDNLIQAVAEVSNLKIKIRTRQGAPSAQEIYRLDKDARVETLVVRSADFHSAEYITQAIDTVIIDGGTFLREGFKKDRKRELAAFLANLSHETGGAGPPLPAVRFAGDCSGTKTSPAGQGSTWMPSLIRQAQRCIPDRRTSAIMGGVRSCSAGTSTTDSSAPLSTGIKRAAGPSRDRCRRRQDRLHDRHPLLDDAAAPKPSAHDVMVGRWKPSPLEKFRGLGSPGFGTTVMVLNGLEANLGETEGSPVQRRAGHYRDITGRMGVDISGEKVDTLGMRPF